MESQKEEREERQSEAGVSSPLKTETSTMGAGYGIPPITLYYSTDEEANHGSCLPSGRDSVAVVTEFLNPI